MIKGNFRLPLIGISLAITNVLCIAIHALLTKREVKMTVYLLL